MRRALFSRQAESYLYRGFLFMGQMSCLWPDWRLKSITAECKIGSKPDCKLSLSARCCNRAGANFALARDVTIGLVSTLPWRSRLQSGWR